jgi:hypothetical protein
VLHQGRRQKNELPVCLVEKKLVAGCFGSSRKSEEVKKENEPRKTNPSLLNFQGNSEDGRGREK